MRVLIIGCGYLGLPLGAKLVSLGHEAFGIRRTHGSDSELTSCAIKPLCADITKPETLAALPSGYEWVVNCVSSAGGNAQEYRRVYVEGTRNVIQWLQTTPPQKYIYTSSTSVYGQIDGSVADENCPAEPAAATAKMLARAEQLLLEPKGRALNPIILRVAGIYGPNRGYWLRHYLSGEAQIEGNGQRWLNMVHRDDVIGAIIAALQRGTPGQIYNVVDDEPVTQLALYQWLSARTGRPLPPVMEHPVGTGRKRGLTNKRVSNRKLKGELGLRLACPTFREGFESELQRAQ